MPAVAATAAILVKEDSLGNREQSARILHNAKRKEDIMPKLVTTEDLKATLTEYTERADLRWLKISDAGQLIDDELSLRGLTQEDVEEILREMSDDDE